MKRFLDLKYILALRIWVFNKWPIRFGHNISLSWDDYEACCLETRERLFEQAKPKIIPGNIWHSIQVSSGRLPKIPTMRDDVRAFLADNNGVVETTSMVHNNTRKVHTFHVCFLDAESLVAFKLRFM